MTQTNSKIKGKFYPLQHHEWLRACRELTPSQRDVLYYIRTLDPHNNGIDINCAEIARQLSGAKKVHRETVSRAIKVLEEKGFIDTEILAVRVKVKPKGLLCHRDDEITHRDEEITQGVTRSRTVIATHPSKPETIATSTSCFPKIYKTYKDFKDSLSQDEREKFLKFVREKIKDFQRPINDVEGWLASENQAGINRWQAYYSMFRKEVGEALTPSQNWENHPKYQEWLNLLQTKGMAFYKVDELDYGDGEIVHFGTSEDRDEREAFANWAKANNKMDFNGRRQLPRQVLIGEGKL